MLPVQTVAKVERKADVIQEHAPAFEPPWDAYYHLFPLPDFLDGEDYVVNFRKVGTSPLRALISNRIACLTHQGWVAFQRRYANFSLRLDPGQQDQLDQTRAEWEELRLWEEWNERGHNPDEFEAWIRAPLSLGYAYAGTERKELLAFAADIVRQDLP